MSEKILGMSTPESNLTPEAVEKSKKYEKLIRYLAVPLGLSEERIKNVLADPDHALRYLRQTVGLVDYEGGIASDIAKETGIGESKDFRDYGGIWELIGQAAWKKGLQYKAKFVPNEGYKLKPVAEQSPEVRAFIEEIRSLLM